MGRRKSESAEVVTVEFLSEDDSLSEASDASRVMLLFQKGKKKGYLTLERDQVVLDGQDEKPFLITSKVVDHLLVRRVGSGVDWDSLHIVLRDTQDLDIPDPKWFRKRAEESGILAQFSFPQGLPEALIHFVKRTVFELKL